MFSSCTRCFLRTSKCVGILLAGTELLLSQSPICPFFSAALHFQPWEARLARSLSLSVCLVVVPCLQTVVSVGSADWEAHLTSSVSLHFFSCLGGALGSISLPSMAQPSKMHGVGSISAFGLSLSHDVQPYTWSAKRYNESYAWGIRRSHDINHRSTRESWRTYGI